MPYKNRPTLEDQLVRTLVLEWLKLHPDMLDASLAWTGLGYRVTLRVLDSRCVEHTESVIFFGPEVTEVRGDIGRVVGDRLHRMRTALNRTCEVLKT